MSRWRRTSQVWQVLTQARGHTANWSETGRNGPGSFRPVATGLISPSTTNLLDPASISTVSHSIPICSSVLRSLLSPHPSLRLHAELASVPLCLFSVWPGPFSSVAFSDLPACILRKSVSYSRSPHQFSIRLMMPEHLQERSKGDHILSCSLKNLKMSWKFHPEMGTKSGKFQLRQLKFKKFVGTASFKKKCRKWWLSVALLVCGLDNCRSSCPLLSQPRPRSPKWAK